MSNSKTRQNVLIMVCQHYCGAKEFGNPSPFHIKPKAHAEEEEMSGDERRRSKLPGDVAEDNLVLGKPRSRKEKAAHRQGQLPEHPKEKHKYNGLTIGVWWMSNSRKN